MNFCELQTHIYLSTNSASVDAVQMCAEIEVLHVLSINTNLTWPKGHIQSVDVC